MVTPTPLVPNVVDAGYEKITSFPLFCFQLNGRAFVLKTYGPEFKPPWGLWFDGGGGGQQHTCFEDPSVVGTVRGCVLRTEGEERAFLVRRIIYISLTVMRTSWTFVLPLGAGAIVAAISFSGLLSLQSLYFLSEFKGYIKSTKSTKSKC